MKKLLTVLLTMLMIITLVGCDSKKEEEPTIEEEPQTEEAIQEEKEESEITGGYTEVEDSTITDELKEIFESATKGLLGASYEPVKLLATQVVNGINYKFLANGTKTTNPITKGTYNITINKSSDGTISLLDIEVIEEKQEEVKTTSQDITNMYFWVVFYDQFGNELQREALKYGTVPEYKSWLPEGFDKWIYKRSGKDVGTLKAITGNTYYQAVCHEVFHEISSPPLEPSPSQTGCSHRGEKIYYILKHEFVTTYTMLFEYNTLEDKYVLTDPYRLIPMVFTSFQVGSFVHNEGTSYVCEDNGDGVVLPNEYNLILNVESGTGGTVNSQQSITIPLVEGTTYQCNSDGTVLLKYNEFQYHSQPTVEPDSGYVFYSWYDGISVEGQSINGTIDSDITISIKFVPAP